jgi:outer membrane protein
MKKIYYIAIIAFLFIGNKGFSQQSYFSAAYSMGFAGGDLKDYVSKSSFRGGVVEYRGYVTNNVTAGVDVGWNVFYERMDYATYTKGTMSLSGIQYRTSNHVPLLLSADYMLKPDEVFNPYVGFGIGTMYSERETDMGMFQTSENTWHFALKPELGFMYAINQAADLKVSARYYYGFKTNNMDAQSYFTINFGFVFKKY